MHLWPSCNGRTRKMLWACEYEYMSMHYAPLLLLPLSRLHHFNFLSVGNKQSLCPLMWGHKRKVRGHIKKFSAGASRGIVPPLANCFRRHWLWYIIWYCAGVVCAVACTLRWDYRQFYRSRSPDFLSLAFTPSSWDLSQSRTVYRNSAAACAPETHELIASRQSPSTFAEYSLTRYTVKYWLCGTEWGWSGREPRKPRILVLQFRDGRSVFGCVNHENRGCEY